MRTFLYELMRRKVLRIAVIYLIASWLIMEAADALLGLPGWSTRLLAVLLLLGLPVVLWLAWTYELTPEGLKRTRARTPDEAAVTHYIHHLEVVILGALLIIVAYLLWGGRLTDEPPISPSAPSQESSPNTN